MKMYEVLISHLRDCAKYDQYENTFSEAADAIEKLEKSIPRWIPVTERLPKEEFNKNSHSFEYVLCATIFGDVRPYRYGRRAVDEEAHFWHGVGRVDNYVTHWMQWPKPPKEKTE